MYSCTHTQAHIMYMRERESKMIFLIKKKFKKKKT